MSSEMRRIEGISIPEFWNDDSFENSVLPNHSTPKRVGIDIPEPATRATGQRSRTFKSNKTDMTMSMLVVV